MTDDREVLRRMGREVATWLGDGPSAAQRQRQAHELLRAARMVRATPYRQRSSKVALGLVAVAAAAIAIVVGGVLWSQRRSAEMPYWRGSELHQGHAGELLVATRDHSLPVRFDDGSSMELVGDSTARILEALSRRVHIRLRYGTLHAALRSRAAVQWSFEAGPFVVRDIGTEFSLSFSRDEDLFEAAVTEGIIFVHGPLLSEHGIRVSTGERLTVDRVERTVVKAPFHSYADQSPHPEIETDGLESKNGAERWRRQGSVSGAGKARVGLRRYRRGRWLAERGERSGSSGSGSSGGERSGSSGSGSSGGERSSAGAGGAPQNNGRPLASRPRASIDEAWKPHYERGAYGEAIDAALASGFSRLLAKSRLVELWQLAEAARYAGRGEQAREALIAIRVRFGSSRRSRIASFLLGRVAMELNDDPRKAATWFATYLREEPDGALAEEAMGRLISAHQHAKDDKAARRAAQAYLDAFPDGLFASLASSVLESSRGLD